MFGRTVLLGAMWMPCTIGASGCTLSGDLCRFSAEYCGGAIEESCPRAASCGQFDRPCTLFVAPDGNDEQNPGTQDAPFATLQRAAGLSNAGDTICARQGTYQGAQMTHSGEPGAPITMRSYPGETATVEGGQFRVMADWGVEVAFVVVEGMEFRASPENDQGIFLHSAHDVVIRNNRFLDSVGGGISGSGARVLIDGNEFARCSIGIVGTGTGFVVTNNRFHSNLDSGVMLSAYPLDPASENQQPLEVYAGGRDWVISNNVFVSNAKTAVVLWQELAVGAAIHNNIFHRNAESEAEPGTNGVSFSGSGSGHTLINNLYDGSGAPVIYEMPPPFVESGAVFEIPGFRDQDAFDFRLQPGSPAIDAGDPSGAPDHDALCVARPIGAAVDVGAYEACEP
jgi:hypothetical protein